MVPVTNWTDPATTTSRRRCPPTPHHFHHPIIPYSSSFTLSFPTLAFLSRFGQKYLFFMRPKLSSLAAHMTSSRPPRQRVTTAAWPVDAHPTSGAQTFFNTGKKGGGGDRLRRRRCQWSHRLGIPVGFADIIIGPTILLLSSRAVAAVATIDM